MPDAPQLDLQQDVPLAPLTTFGVGGPARYFAVASTEQEVVAAFAWANQRGLPVFVLGGGSNLLVHDQGFAGLVLRMGILGTEDGTNGLFDVGAGEVWDAFVSRMVADGMAGIECMAGIPGSVGGTPVQNVGAYGQEVSETIASVRAFDRRSSEFVELTREQCRFRYRESLFNTDEPGRYVVTRVRFQLRPAGAATLRYAELAKRFEGQNPPTLAQVAAVVREIRQSKGMLLVDGDPNCRSAGSFFKNPIVDPADLTRVAAGLGIPVDDVPRWPAANGHVKLPAAWLLEKAGFVKGFSDGAVGISTCHTLALVNRGNATFRDIERLQNQIVAVVAEKFCVILEREPVMLG